VLVSRQDDDGEGEQASRERQFKSIRATYNTNACLRIKKQYKNAPRSTHPLKGISMTRSGSRHGISALVPPQKRSHTIEETQTKRCRCIQPKLQCGKERRASSKRDVIVNQRYCRGQTISNLRSTSDCFTHLDEANGVCLFSEALSADV